MSKKGSTGFRCPACRAENTHVCDSRGSKGKTYRRRRRFCEACGYRFSTVEVTATEYDARVGRDAVIALRAKVMSMIDQHFAAHEAEQAA